MGVIESFKKYEELDVQRAEEIELRKSTAIPRNTRNESRNSDKARCAHNADSNVTALQVELSEMKEELTAARGGAKAEPSADTTQRVRELEATVADLEGKFKLAKAEAKSSSSGRVRAPRAGVGATTSNVTVLGTTAAFLTPASSELLASAATVPEGGSDVAGARRVSARKCAQADSSGAAPVSSNKRQKKLEDPLAGWVMQYLDTGEKLTAHEWVERFPEEFAQCYKKDHQRYLEYLAHSGGYQNKGMWEYPRSTTQPVSSSEPDKTCVPSGESAIESLCPSIFVASASQIRMVPSSEADTMRVPSGENATDPTESLCSSIFLSWAPFAASQIRKVLSPGPDTTRAPSGYGRPGPPSIANDLGIESFVYIDDTFGVNLVDDMSYYRPYEGLFPTPQVQTLCLWDDISLPYERAKQLWGPQLTVIGLEVDPNAMTFAMSEPRRAGLLAGVEEFCHIPPGGRRHSLRKFQQLAGWVSWALNVYPLLRPALSHVYEKMKGKTNSDAGIFVNSGVVKDLTWFAHHVRASSGILLLDSFDWEPADADVVAYCDASLAGLGVYFPRSAFCVSWCLHRIAELVRANGKVIVRKITVWTDNSNTYDIFNSLRTLPLYNEILKSSVDVLLQNNFKLRVLLLPGKRNVVADALSRWENAKAIAVHPDLIINASRSLPNIPFTPPRVTLGLKRND
ncbi:hypothetical protein B0H13DRAFT_2309913 [Mycena leptocephala]|nr:hypothetical protein B0H13DRAFT_2309913 [Mycena leptocephala]